MSTISDHIIYRRTAPLLMVLTFVLAIGAVVGTYVNDRNDQARDRAITQANTRRIVDNTQNAITSCRNANESREASRTLWYFVVDLTSENADASEAAYLRQVREWIGVVYQPHDCRDLSRKYTIPPPPAIPGR